jgi:hypothetical protein
MADERVHKKTNFAQDAAAPVAPLPSRPKAPSPPQQNGGDLQQQQLRLEQEQQQRQQLQQQQEQQQRKHQSPQQQQEPQAQALTYPEQKDFAHRRDIYSIHGEQVCPLNCQLGQHLHPLQVGFACMPA